MAQTQCRTTPVDVDTLTDLCRAKMDQQSLEAEVARDLAEARVLMCQLYLALRKVEPRAHVLIDADLYLRSRGHIH